jgi:hypothetical protein
VSEGGRGRHRQLPQHVAAVAGQEPPHTEHREQQAEAERVFAGPRRGGCEPEHSGDEVQGVLPAAGADEPGSEEQADHSGDDQSEAPDPGESLGGGQARANRGTPRARRPTPAVRPSLAHARDYGASRSPM